MDERYSFLKKENGGVAIALKADEHIVAGADFKLVDSDTKEVVESWKATVDKGNTFIHRFRTSVDKLDKLVLSWAIVCCSAKRNAFEGNIQLAISQGMVPTKVSKPMNYSVTNVPPCGIDSNESFKGNLIFLLDKNIEDTKL